MNRTIENLIVTWTSDEADQFFAYLDQVATQADTKREEEGVKPRPSTISSRAYALAS